MAAMEAQFIQHSTNKEAHGEKHCARRASSGWRTLRRHWEYLHVPLMFLAHTCTVQDFILCMFMHIMLWADNSQAVVDLPYSTHEISHTIITHLILFLIVTVAIKQPEHEY